jgi:hypothetical protein
MMEKELLNSLGDFYPSFFNVESVLYPLEAV